MNKKIVFSILILLLLIVILKPLLGENFQSYCDFMINKDEIPHLNLYKCLDRCLSHGEEDDCSYQQCHDKCVNCIGDDLTNDEKKRLCPWYTTYNKESTYLDKIELRLIAGDGNCLIEWKAPRPDVESYYIFVDELYDQKSRTEVKVIESKCTDCSYVYENLDNGSTYTIFMKCLLQNGKYLESERLTVTILGESFESKHEEYKQMSGHYYQKHFPKNCFKNINDENHILDRVTLDELDFNTFLDRL